MWSSLLWGSPTPQTMRIRDISGLRGHFITLERVPRTGRHPQAVCWGSQCPRRVRPWLRKCRVLGEAALWVPPTGTDAPTSSFCHQPPTATQPG